PQQRLAGRGPRGRPQPGVAALLGGQLLADAPRRSRPRTHAALEVELHLLRRPGRLLGVATALTRFLGPGGPRGASVEKGGMRFRLFVAVVVALVGGALAAPRVLAGN